jgi:serine/threonine protein kinase
VESAWNEALETELWMNRFQFCFHFAFKIILRRYTMMRTIAHCHNLGVIHRDLKPENFVLETKARESLRPSTRPTLLRRIGGLRTSTRPTLNRHIGVVENEPSTDGDSTNGVRASA